MREFNFIKKQHRLILTTLKVTDKGILGTNLETYLLIKDKGDLKNGLYDVDLTESNQDVNDYPLVDFTTCDNSELVTFDIKELKDLLKHVSKDETRLNLNGIYIGNGEAVACDGYTLKLKECSNTKNEYIIPRSSLTILIRLVKKGNITFSLSHKFAIVDTVRYTFKIRLIQRDYVKYKTVIPKSYNHSLIIEQWPTLKEIKALSPNKNFSVAFECDKGVVKLKVCDTDQVFDVGFCPKKLNLTIGFNASLIQRALKSNKDTKFFIELNSEIQPTNVNGVIVMPLRL